MSELRAIGSFAKQLKRVNDGNSSTADVYSVTKYDGFVRSLDYFKKQVFSRDLSSYKIVRKGEFAYSTIHLDEGALGLLEDKEALISPMYTTFQVDESVDRQYIAYLLKSPDLVAQYSLIGQGSINRRKSVAFSSLAELEVFTPPLPEQKKIAEILSGIDKLISNNKAHIAKKEQLLAAVLSERFCEIRNQTESTPLGDCCTHILDFRGRTPAKLGMDWGGGTIRALSANNVRNGYIDFNRECYMGGEPLYERWMTRGDCKQGDIIFTMEAPMGNVAIIPNNEKYILSQRVVLISPERKSVLPEYMYWYMRSTYFRADCEYLATGTTAKGIKQANLITIEIPLPPMHAQEKVTSLANSLDTSLKIEKDLLSQLIMLKQSLSSDLLSGRKRVTV